MKTFAGQQIIRWPISERKLSGEFVIFPNTVNSPLCALPQEKGKELFPNLPQQGASQTSIILFCTNIVLPQENRYQKKHKKQTKKYSKQLSSCCVIILISNSITCRGLGMGGRFPLFIVEPLK